MIGDCYLISQLYHFLLCIQYIDEHGKKHWRCLWCNRTFQHWNATKALSHVNKVPNTDVRKCSSKAIDPAHQKEYKRLLDKHTSRKNAHKLATESKKRSSEEYLAGASEAYAATQKRKPPPVYFVNTTSGTPSSQAQTEIDTGIETPLSRQSKDSKKYYQTTLVDTVGLKADEKLTMAIADLIHSCGLPFSLASHHKFQVLLNCAKNATTNYTPPGRNRVGGELLDLNYKLYKSETMKRLMKEADVYGITFFGDAATVKKAPLINILAASAHLPVACLRIVDCRGHLENDGQKDAGYITELFLPHITEAEEKSPQCTDLVIFDGASNVQKAGLLLEAKFPHLSVMHGAEHVISLFYSDVFKIREFDLLKRFNRHIYKYFGSGSMHSPYAIFSKHAREHNDNKPIGLIRAADTRMGGHVISMMRTLRLKDSILSTISSASFLQGKFKVRTYNNPPL